MTEYQRCFGLNIVADRNTFEALFFFFFLRKQNNAASSKQKVGLFCWHLKDNTFSAIW